MSSTAYETFRFGQHELSYRVFGEGPRTTVLLHGLLLSQKMHKPLAHALADRGHRVVTLDLLGHGRSARPRDMTAYSMPLFAEQVVALLDHLELDDAVVGGTSLGANVALETAVLAPERVRGLLVEMPVLDNALLGCALAFTPLLSALTFGEPIMKLVARGTRLLPTRRIWPLEVLLDTVRQEPGPSAAVLQGLFFGAWPRPAGCARRSPRRPWSSATRPTRSTRSATPTRSCTSCPTRSCCGPTRSSSCASPRPGSPARSPSSSTTAGSRGGRRGGGRTRRRRGRAPGALV